MKPKHKRYGISDIVRRLLVDYYKSQTIGGRKHDQDKSRPETPAMAPMPKVQQSAAVVSDETKSDVVSEMRRQHDRRLETGNSKGGETETSERNTPAQGTLVVKLVRLKAYCEEKVIAISQTRIIGKLTPEDCVDQGKMRAYVDIEIRLTQLIASETHNKPTGG